MTRYGLMTLTAVVSAGVAGFAGDVRADHRYPSCNSHARTTYVETVPVRYYEPAPCVRTLPANKSCGRPVYREHRPVYRERRPRYVEVRHRPAPRRHVVRYAPRHHRFRPEVRVRLDGRSRHRQHRRGFSLHIGR